MKSKTKTKFNLRNYILASIALHFLLVAATTLLSALEKSNRSQPVEVVLTDPTPEKPIDPQDIHQIVETDSQFANNQTDEKAKYHSEKSNTVEKETRAKTGEQFKNSLRQGSKTVATQKAQKAQAAQLLNPNFDPYAALVKQTNAQIEKELVKSQTGAQTGEASTTNDNLNVQEDLITKLNTKEYKYYGYYHRIKMQLNQWWQPKVREKVTKMVNQGRTIASEENKTTRLIIILNDAGTLVKVQVLAESGVRDLDDAAIEAFRSAAPFPNPPKGIIENDGTIKIRWDFVIES